MHGYLYAVMTELTPAGKKGKEAEGKAGKEGVTWIV